MFSARLPGELVDQVVELAEEEGVSQAALVEELLGEALDRRRGLRRAERGSE